MKKLLTLSLTALLLFTLFPVPLQADEAPVPTTNVSFTEPIDISEAGAGAFGVYGAGHGNHQTRVVHTSHGTYTAYLTELLNRTDDIAGSETTQLFSIIKINEDGTTRTVFQESKPYDSSQISVVVDNDENVWAVVVCNNGYKNQFDGRPTGMYLAAYCVNADTDTVKGYTTILPCDSPSTLGYSAFTYDPSQNQIYAVIVNGNSIPSTLYWTVFDVESHAWLGDVHSLSLEDRHAYHFLCPDGKGGLMIVNQRNCHTYALGYPEVASNDGIRVDGDTITDLVTGESIQARRENTEWNFDQLDLYYIPDVSQDDYVPFSVVKADYSRVIGDQAYRNSLEGRKNNLYPAIGCYEGDVYLDTNGYLHILYYVGFSRSGLDNARVDRYWEHKVYDVSDPNNIHELSCTRIIDELKDGVAQLEKAPGTQLAEETAPGNTVVENSNGFRLYEDSNHQMFMVRGQLMYILRAAEGATRTSKENSIMVYAVKGTPEEGYTYEELDRKFIASGQPGAFVLSTSSRRSNSYVDGKIDVIWQQGDQDYNYLQISLKPSDISVKDSKVTIQGISVKMTDQNGNLLAIGENELNILATDNNGAVFRGKTAEDGTVSFEPFLLSEPGEYTLTFTMEAGTDKAVAYSTDVFVMTLQVTEKDGGLTAEMTGLTKNGEAADELLFEVVKTVSDSTPGTGDFSSASLWLFLTVTTVAGMIVFILRRKHLPV